MTGSSENLRLTVAQAGAILHNQGMVDYLGHVSARTTRGCLIKPKHSPDITGLDRLRPEHMIEVDSEGNELDSKGQPPAEVYIHSEIYKARPDVNAIVHTHQPAATMAGILEIPIKPLLHIPASYVDQDEVRLWPCPLLVTNSDLGAELAAALGDGKYCHLQGHGIVAVGKSVQEAVIHAVMLEELAKANLTALSTGCTPREISPQELVTLRADRASIDGRWAYYEERIPSRICCS